MIPSRPQVSPGKTVSADKYEKVESPAQRPPLNVRDLMGFDGQAPVMAGMRDAAPSMSMTAGVSAGVSAWQNNKHITSLWCINQNRNSWVGVDGVGWKKLANNSDSAIVALTMLAAHARDHNGTVNYREESDGMIYEMYVW